MPEAAGLGGPAARRRAARGVIHLGLRTAVTLAVVFAGTVVLTRALDPLEFGVYAVLQFALAFLQFFGDAGLGAALVQGRDEPSERALANVFTLHLLLALAILAVAWAAAPALHRAWPTLPGNAPALLRAMSLTFLVGALRLVPAILLERDLRFGVIASAEVAQVIAFYATACACALTGLRPWTWPAAVLAQAVVGAAAVMAARPWRPRLALDRAVLGPLLRFGLPFQLKNLIGFANNALTPLYAGSALGSAAVGLIGWAQQVAYLPLRLVEVVARVSFPLFSRMQHDGPGLARALEHALQLCALGAFFTSGILLGAGPNVTVVVFSGKWLPGLFALYAFSAALLVGFVSPVVAALLDALGRPGVIARLAAGWTALNWVVVPLATWRWGLPGFAAGWCVHVVAGNLLLLLILPGLVPGTRLLRPLRAPALGGLLVAALAWFVLRPWATTLPRLAGGAVAALALHLAVFAALEPQALRAARRLLAPGTPGA